MYALLGNFEAKVEVPGMEGYVYFRAQVYHTIEGLPRMQVGVAEVNEEIPPVYDLPVVIFQGKVIRRYGDG